MKKENLMKLAGMTEELAEQISEMSAQELKNMVPQTRLNEVIQERDHAKEDHAQVLKKLGKLEKDASDLETLRGQIQTLQADAENQKNAHAAEIIALKKDNFITAAIMRRKARNVKAVRALLDTEKSKLNDDGTVEGVEEQLDALQAAEDSKFMFGDSGRLKGATFGESGDSSGGDQAPDYSKMTYEEIDTYMTGHPDTK